jgi:hypothetical protein
VILKKISEPYESRRLLKLNRDDFWKSAQEIRSRLKATNKVFSDSGELLRKYRDKN